MWIWATAASLAIGFPYLVIAYLILRGLIQAHQLTRNPLALGTALIFLSCGVGHLMHGEHMLFGDELHRRTADLHITVWDASTAVIALWYLTMRRRYGQLLHGPVMFDDVDRTAAEAATRHAATHDPLTGLLNRQALLDALLRLTAPANDTATGALLFLDVDWFKQVNDEHGHTVGDSLLIAVALRLRETARPTDLVARLGGDEFLLYLAAPTDAEEAKRAAERVANAMRRPFEVAGRTLEVSCSIGVALTAPGQKPTQLLDHADQAMYAAKRTGRGRPSMWKPQDGDGAQRAPPLTDG